MSIALLQDVSCKRRGITVYTENYFQQYFNFETLDKTVEECCRISTHNPKAFYLFIQRYTHFNAVPSSLVARLASSIGLSRNLFRDPNCEVDDEADRGLEVAAKVLAASIEEHSDANHQGFSHRILGQATLKSAGNYAGLSTKERNELSQIPDWFKHLIAEQIDIYQGVPGNLETLIKAMGFHAASEMLADREYTVIDKVIRYEQSSTGFFQFLKDGGGKVELDNKQISSWYWIGVHSSYQRPSVEQEHFAAALDALNLAIRYFPHCPEQIHNWILSGFEKFVQLQQKFFSELYKECEVILMFET